jgi:hypothetical protein
VPGQFYTNDIAYEYAMNLLKSTLCACKRCYDLPAAFARFVIVWHDLLIFEFDILPSALQVVEAYTVAL